MAAVFAHGRLRLYLLKLLDEAPRHGYEVIRLLEERFQGLYAPSAGTVYPRLAKLEQEGLVTHSTEGGRKVYSITDAGRAELASRDDELADLENEIRDSVSSLAAEIREDVRGAAGDLRREIRAATQQATRTQPKNSQSDWKEQMRRSKEEIRQAREEARSAKRAAKEAQDAARDEVQRIARRVQEEVQDHVRRGDWQAGVREGLAELTRELGAFGRTTSWPPPYTKPEQPAETPEWGAEDAAVTDDPARDLERLLDRFRDDVRDASRDNGVDAEQLREVRRHLSTAAAHIGVVLRGKHKDQKD
ncbi:helix-turn-helix transcriptional regulator [Streptomyces sp. NPDC002574]|uniref:PadR family transcriptional regulator n=1 Tax=Streptomyces sp. NPDC002574 TaxID=3364652 RepID=UPI0036CC22C4